MLISGCHQRWPVRIYELPWLGSWHTSYSGLKEPLIASLWLLWDSWDSALHGWQRFKTLSAQYLCSFRFISTNLQGRRTVSCCCAKEMFWIGQQTRCNVFYQCVWKLYAQVSGCTCWCQSFWLSATERRYHDTTVWLYLLNFSLVRGWYTVVLSLHTPKNVQRTWQLCSQTAVHCPLKRFVYAVKINPVVKNDIGGLGQCDLSGRYCLCEPTAPNNNDDYKLESGPSPWEWLLDINNYELSRTTRWK